jgi:hypothetical protein
MLEGFADAVQYGESPRASALQLIEALEVVGRDDRSDDAAILNDEGAPSPDTWASTSGQRRRLRRR